MMRRCCFVSLAGLIVCLVLSSCSQPNLPWRSGRLVTQLYRQYKSEILLAYNNFDDEMIVDAQHGYERAYFDNYRNEIIFIHENKLEYLMNGRKVRTSGDGLTGYIIQIVLSPDYQIGIEMLDSKIGADKGSFWGEKSRVMNLQTLENVVVDGAMFANGFIAGRYLYNVAHDYNSDEFLNIIDLTTMTHTQIKTEENDITFLYQIGEQVYAQVASKKTAFLLDGTQMIEQKEKYDARLPNADDAEEYGVEYLNDIAPIDSKDHWYVEPRSVDRPIHNTRLLIIRSNGQVDETSIKFSHNDVSQILDATSYGNDKFALCYYRRNPTTQKMRAYISIYNLLGEELEVRDITTVDRDDSGRFMYLDYVV